MRRKWKLRLFRLTNVELNSASTECKSTGNVQQKSHQLQINGRKALCVLQYFNNGNAGFTDASAAGHFGTKTSAPNFGAEVSGQFGTNLCDTLRPHYTRIG